ncbi:MAG: porphobilinogen synthase [Bacteroidetes bacterium SW_11_45_7]|nr:MAG: porphobilinogen synthase [Bacteroidetes bacterium SW_11_45_7]
MDMSRRPRRNRQSKAIRSLVRETHLRADQLVYPLFLLDGEDQAVEIPSLPGNYRLSIDKAKRTVEECMNSNLQSFILFPVIDESLKDSYATYSYDENNVYLRAIRELKTTFPEMCIITDIALDPYSSDGHDGVVKDGGILNDETLPILAKMGLAQAEAGADILGPSDMMDGRVGFIRQTLDEKGFSSTAIMSYTAKYASAFYGPFRDALSSAPKGGDKKSYQMDPANKREALVEAELDDQEGADYLMVKPALLYLDIIQQLDQNFEIPIAAYNVSGECSMVKAAVGNGWLTEEEAMMEMLLSIKRAGANIVISYFAKEAAEWLQKNGS